MSDANFTATLGNDNASERGKQTIFSRLTSPLAKSIFLASVIGMTFFISEHSVDMSKHGQDNFVEEIEDQEAWADGGNKFRQFSFLGCACIGVVSLLIGRTGSFRLNLPVLLIAIYVLWAGASTTWSIDPGTTMRRYALVLCCVIGCFGYARFLKVEDAVLAALLVSVGYLLLGIGAEIFYGAFRPHLGDYRFAGTIHPNIQAASLAMGCIAAYTMARIKPDFKVAFYAAFGLLFLFLVLTKCRSATGAVPVALGMIWFASQPIRNILIGIMVGFWMVSTIVLVCIVSDFNPIAANQEVLLMGRGEETGTSLTGRLPLWEDLLGFVVRSPLKGYGFGAFWTPKHIYEIAASQEWVISEAHSTYLDTTLQLGIIGAVLLTAIEICTFLYASFLSRVTQQPAYLFLVGGIFFCILRGLTESGLTGASPVTAFLFVALAAHSWNGNRASTDPQYRPTDHLKQTA